MVSSKYVNCDICEKVVKDTSLRKHIKAIHEKAREHICPHCNKAFSQRFTLKEHISAKHTKGYEHKCALCHRQFAHKTNFTRHMKTVHAGPTELDHQKWLMSKLPRPMVMVYIPDFDLPAVKSVRAQRALKKNLRSWEEEKIPKQKSQRSAGDHHNSLEICKEKNVLNSSNYYAEKRV